MSGETVAALSSEAAQIRELNRILQLYSPSLVGPGGEAIGLPASVSHALKEVVRNMSAGRAVTVVPQKQLLTTQSAADLLGFSRPHLIKLLESGAIPFQKVGRHRRVHLQDVMAFQGKRDAERRKALDELARAEFAEGMYESIGIAQGDE